MNALPPICDFCDQPIDKDGGEELTPIWIGEPPKQEYLSVTGYMSKPKSRQSAHGWHFLGHNQWEIGAVVQALLEHPWVDFTPHNQVREVKDIPMVSDGGPVMAEPPDVELNTDKAAANLKVEPKVELSEPDMELCRFCAESFQSSR